MDWNEIMMIENPHEALKHMAKKVDEENLPLQGMEDRVEEYARRHGITVDEMAFYPNGGRVLDPDDVLTIEYEAQLEKVCESRGEPKRTMSRELEEFRWFYQVTGQVIGMSKVLDEKAMEFLKVGYPCTKEDILSLRFWPMPECEDALKLSAELLPLKSFSGYEEMRELSVELISRIVVVLLAIEDVQKIFSMYRGEDDVIEFNQFKATLANAVHGMRYTHYRLDSLYREKSWKLFEPITDLIPEVENAGQIGWWVFNQKPKNPGEPTPAPYVHYEPLPFRVLDAVYEFVEDHPRYNLPDAYGRILQKNGISWSDDGMKGADVNELDDQCILALIIGTACAERFSEGTIKRFFHDGTMLRWMERLDELEYE